MTVREIEFKYDAKGIPLDHFKEVCIAQDPNEYIISGGDDHFYSCESDNTAFLRHRIGGEYNEITLKHKKSDYVRTEDTLYLSDQSNSFNVRAFMYRFGFNYTNTINKTTHTYIFDRYSICYYVCRNKDLKEMGRYVEIEVNDDPNMSEDALFLELLALERVYGVIGLSPEKRIIQSLFELFKNSP